MWSIKGYFFRGDYLDPCGTINGYHLDETTASLREKYWGEIYSSSYHHYMALLQSRLNRTHSEQSLNGRKYIRNNWEKLLAYNHEYMGFAEGRIRDTTPHLKEKHLVYLQKFRFEVWAGGYNWLVDNELSGDRIKERIDQIMDLYEKTNEGYGKIILISHSMGGVVARSMQKKYERDLKDKVLHVIHGAMPANGSAETYSIVRKGVAGAVRQILGPDAPLPGWCCCGPPVLCSFCHLNEKDTMAYLTLTVAHTVQKVGSGMNATA